MGVAGVSVDLDTSPEQPGRQLDPGTLAEALAELASEVRRDVPSGGLLLTIDEMQEASAAASHYCQRRCTGSQLATARPPSCSRAPACPTLLTSCEPLVSPTRADCSCSKNCPSLSPGTMRCLRSWNQRGGRVGGGTRKRPLT